MGNVDITMIWVSALVLYVGLPATTAASSMPYPHLHSHPPSTIRIRREPPPAAYQNSLSQGYSPPYRPPQPSYGAPARPQFVQPAVRYGPPKHMFGSAPPRYGPPRMMYRAPMPSYGPPKSIFGPPRVNYGPPQARPSYGAPARPYRSPLGSYGSPSAPVGLHRLPFGSPHRVPQRQPHHGHHHHSPQGGFKVAQGGFAEPNPFGEGHLPHTNPAPDFSQSFGAQTSPNAYRPQQTVSVGDKPREINIGSSFGTQKPANYYGSPESFNDLGEQKPASDYQVPDTSSLYGDVSTSASQKPSAVIYGSAKPHRAHDSDSAHAPSKPFVDYQTPGSTRNVNKPPSTSYGKPTGAVFSADYSSNSYGVTEAPLNTPIKSISYTLPTETFSSLNIGNSKKPGGSYKTQSNVNSKPPRSYSSQNDFSNDGIITHPNSYDSQSAASQFYNSPPNVYDKPNHGYKTSGDSHREGPPTSYESQYDSYSSPSNFQNSPNKPQDAAPSNFYNADSGSNYNQQPSSGTASQQNYDSYNSYQPSSNNQYSQPQSHYHHKSPYSAHPGKSTQYSHIPQSWKNASLKSIYDPYYNGPWNSNYYPPSATYDTISLSLKDDPTKTPQTNFQVYDTLSASLQDVEQQKETHAQKDIQPTSGYQVATQNDAPSHQNVVVSTSNPSSFQAPIQTFGFQPSQNEKHRGEVKFPSLADVSQEFSAGNVAAPHGSETVKDTSSPAHVLSPNYYGSTNKHYGEKLHARTPTKFFAQTNEQTSEVKATQTPQTRVPIRNKETSDSSNTGSRSFTVNEKVSAAVLPTPVAGTNEQVR